MKGLACNLDAPVSCATVPVDADLRPSPGEGIETGAAAGPGEGIEMGAAAGPGEGIETDAGPGYRTPAIMKAVLNPRTEEKGQTIVEGPLPARTAGGQAADISVNCDIRPPASMAMDPSPGHAAGGLAVERTQGTPGRGGVLQQDYARWLKGYDWDYFLTVTFRSPRREPYYALKHVWHALEEHSVGRAFLGVEPHQSGDLHIHGIVAGAAPGWRPEIDLPWDVWSGLFHRFGRAKVAACNSREAVTAYCAKYLLKQQSRVTDYYGVFGTKSTWVGGRCEPDGSQGTGRPTAG